ncbi:kinase-like domain-containing protein, partial [Phycomyces nitens]
MSLRLSCSFQRRRPSRPKVDSPCDIQNSVDPNSTATKNTILQQTSRTYHKTRKDQVPPLPPLPPTSPRSTPNKPKSTKPPNIDTLLQGIGQYTFLGPLGDGKFSRVILAQHYLTGERFAIKVIDKRIHDYRIMSRLVREVVLMELLDHPNIVHLHETIETADSLFLIMEYVPGMNLDEHLVGSDGLLGENEARAIFRQMVSAVDYCHRRWVVHRDLKAPNVMLTPQGQVRLADFGLGNRYGLHRLRTICGSMLYYSPEIISGQKYVGPEVDCWCLGITLFRMTAGFELFSHARTASELKKIVLSRHYPMPAHLSDGLKQTIQKCLAFDRKKRRGIRHALRNDAWMNDNGKLKDVFQDSPDVTMDMMLAAENDGDDRRVGQDAAGGTQKMQKANRTVVYHPLHPSIYFTSNS